MDKERDIKAGDFRQLLKMAIDAHNIDPKKTYIEFTWWDATIFKPLTYIDRNENGEPILIFGNDNCSFYKAIGGKNHGLVFPTGFYIWKEATRAEQVLHRPLTLNRVIESIDWIKDDEQVIKFLFSNSPINYYVQINPFKTWVYRNRNNETILTFYADDRDSGEFIPASYVTKDRIQFFED